ncbi:hypothetical protein Q4534_16060 [Cyclobacterium sp. 1_MG-2023]|uniref:hypothetical protein n=1 Tax=Cyclobacterium sp. 1_MG-2023 TaxID=3062681 RepID=UPI0026E258BB|nr:hypothetical protein [Cyclobacterium sp. 1_MG-2023]MDO6438937.1 hypothetical protein [Cyclobacterium sp. 1_MG-2023]
MNWLILIITGAIGAILTFIVSEQLEQGAVRASALLSLIVGLFFYCFPDLLNPYLTKNIQIVFIGSTFVGMVSSNFMSGYTRLALAGSLFSIVYINNSGFYEGYGGALGALALIALLSTMGISEVLSKKNKLTNSFQWIRNRVYNPKK